MDDLQKQANKQTWPNNSPKQKNPTNQKQNKKKWYRFFPNQGLGDLKTRTCWPFWFLYLPSRPSQALLNKETFFQWFNFRVAASFLSGFFFFPCLTQGEELGVKEVTDILFTDRCDLGGLFLFSVYCESHRFECKGSTKC